MTSFPFRTREENRKQLKIKYIVKGCVFSIADGGNTYHHQPYLASYFYIIFKNNRRVNVLHFVSPVYKFIFAVVQKSLGPVSSLMLSR